MQSNIQPKLIILLDTESSQKASKTASSLYPFNILHPSFELRCGALRLFEKVQRCFPASKLAVCAKDDERELHIAAFSEKFGIRQFPTKPYSERLSEDTLVLGGNVVMNIALRNALQNSVSGSTEAIVFTSNGAAFGAYFPKNTSAESLSKFLRNPDEKTSQANNVEIPEAKVLCYLWDAIGISSTAILDDAPFFMNNEYRGGQDRGGQDRGGQNALSGAGVYALAPENISIGAGSTIAPCVVLDARKGAIILGENVEIQPHVSIVGPCFIGDNALVKAGARIYEGTSLGAFSKVGGEIKSTIFQGFGNKQHDGCLGYSFIGEWVNLGAGTDVSDLKNNYGTIRVRFLPDKADEISTGVSSLGLLAGDHTKSAINTSFNTGTVTGISANVFEGAPDKFVQSFSWGGKPDSPFFDEEKAVELAKTVMSRRKRELLSSEEKLLRQEFTRVLKKF